MEERSGAHPRHNRAPIPFTRTPQSISSGLESFLCSAKGPLATQNSQWPAKLRRIEKWKRAKSNNWLEELALNQHLGEFRGGDLACLPGFTTGPRCIGASGSELEHGVQRCFHIGTTLYANSRVDFSGRPPISGDASSRCCTPRQELSAAEASYQYYFFEGNRAKWQGKLVANSSTSFSLTGDPRSLQNFRHQSALDSGQS